MSIYVNITDLSSPKGKPNFAEQAAHDAFGRNYVHPKDRDFKDRRPGEWRKLGNVASRVLAKSARRMMVEKALRPTDGEAA